MPEKRTSRRGTSLHPKEGWALNFPEATSIPSLKDWTVFDKQGLYEFLDLAAITHLSGRDQ